MKSGVYVAHDLRKDPRVPVTPIALLIVTDNGRLELLNTEGNNGNVLETFPDEETDFIDDETSGHVVIPFPEGQVELFWPTKARLQELHWFTSEFDNFPSGDEAEDELQARLSRFIAGTP